MALIEGAVNRLFIVVDCGSGARSVATGLRVSMTFAEADGVDGSCFNRRRNAP